MSAAVVEAVALPGRRTVRPTVRPTGRALPQGEVGGTALRLTRRGRVVLGLLAGLVAAVGVLGAQSAQAGPAADPVPVVRHVVDRGDTLWRLAAGVAAPGEDVRDVVAQLQALNRLEGQDLRVGQELLLPAG